jgi:hypothetical protein
MTGKLAFSSSEDPDNRRIAERHTLTGTQLRLLLDGTQYTVHLKDLSSTGLCGLTDAPLARGQMVCLLLGKYEPIAAEIRWIRNTLIGAAFTEELPFEQVSKLRRAHACRKK